MYELSDGTLKQLSKTHEDVFSSEKMSAFVFGISGVTVIAIAKIYIYVVYTALDGVLSNSVPYTQFSESYLLGACLYMPLWYAAVSTLFFSARERMALPKYNDHVKDSQNENEQTIIRRALWNIYVINDKLGLNCWIGVIVNPILAIINIAVATSLGAKLKGVDNQTAADMAILGAASACIGAIVVTPLKLGLDIRYRLTGNNITFFPVIIKAHDEVSDSNYDMTEAQVTIARAWRGYYQSLSDRLDQISDISFTHNNVQYNTTCPISHSVMTHPVKLTTRQIDGHWRPILFMHVFDKASIERHFETRNTNPMNNIRCSKNDLQPFPELKAFIRSEARLRNQALVQKLASSKLSAI